MKEGKREKIDLKSGRGVGDDWMIYMNYIYLIHIKSLFSEYITMCPWSSDPFCIVSYYIKWVTSPWTYFSSQNIFFSNFDFVSLRPKVILRCDLKYRKYIYYVYILYNVVMIIWNKFYFYFGMWTIIDSIESNTIRKHNVTNLFLML